jgi:hypothetical protein
VVLDFLEKLFGHGLGHEGLMLRILFVRVDDFGPLVFLEVFLDNEVKKRVKVLGNRIVVLHV